MQLAAERKVNDCRIYESVWRQHAFCIDATFSDLIKRSRFVKANIQVSLRHKTPLSPYLLVKSLVISQIDSVPLR